MRTTTLTNPFDIHVGGPPRSQCEREENMMGGGVIRLLAGGGIRLLGGSYVCRPLLLGEILHRTQIIALGSIVRSCCAESAVKTGICIPPGGWIGDL